MRSSPSRVVRAAVGAIANWPLLMDDFALSSAMSAMSCSIFLSMAGQEPRWMSGQEHSQGQARDMPNTAAYARF